MTSKHDVAIEKSRNIYKVAFFCLLIGGSVLVGGVWTDWGTNNPFIPDVDTTTTTTTNTTTVTQGIKITGTAAYANTTPVTGQTLYGLDANDEAEIIATITNGAFTSNRAEAGTYDLYIAITGCRIYIGSVIVPASTDYDQESVSIGAIKVYTTATTYTAQLIGATSNSFTSGGSAGTTDYTQSASVAESYTLRITNTHDYTTLFRQYTDPRDDIPVAPVLWIEVNATNAYPTDTYGLGVQHWSDATKTYILVPIDQIVCEGTTNIALVWNFELTFPSAGTFTFTAYLVDGSSMTHLLQAKTRVANPATSETISNTQIMTANCIVT